jgi:uncharacterized damage-inducible protein DinB
MDIKKVSQQEPWLRGTHQHLPAIVRAVVHALEMTEEDVLTACAPLSYDQLMAKPLGLTSVGFHIRHIAGSLDRLLTYAEGGELSAEQVAAMRSESEFEEFIEDWRDEFVAELQRARTRVEAFAQADLEEPRYVGRKRLPTTVGGLLVHCADHSLRHVGQIVTTARAEVAQRQYD